ncbi:MAG: DUF721 domain-containing protein [Alphaproteobacteria bacterium]|nr:DUF721 domain-containing protein [Alphaproteobacteria bacterium]
MTGSRTAGGPRRFGDLARPLLSPALRRQGFAQHEIVTRWRDIVGALLAARSMPERLRFQGAERTGGTLFIRVESSFALEFQHLTPQILDRVNTYYGYRAVTKLILRQGPLPRRPAPRPDQTPELTAELRQSLAEALRGVKDGPTREALDRLGRRLLAPHRSPR